MKRSSRILAGFLLVAIVGTSCFFIGRSTMQNKIDSKGPIFDLYEEIGTLLNQSYYQQVDTDKVADGALHGMVEALGDPYTQYMNSEELADYNAASEESYEGIGVQVSKDEQGYPVIIRVFANTPAEKAGLQVNDRIRSIDGQEVDPEQELTVISNRIRGEKGTKVTLIVERNDQKKEFEAERSEIEIQYVESQMLEGKIGYITLSEFSLNCVEEFQTALQDLQDRGAKALILDLRSNPGGYVDSAVAIADMLLPSGKIVYTKDKNGNEQTYTSDAKCVDLPMAVLINENSASASEILVGALQDHEVATVVGMKSYGKGVIQRVLPISNGGALRVTIAAYYTPNGRNIHGVGITPDVEVQLPDEVLDDPTLLTEQTDTQLQKAIEVIQQRLNPAATPTPNPVASPEK